MAGEERDARLILRAEDRASRTFQQVANSIKDVRKEIADQSNAAREGTGDLDALKKSLKELQNAGDDLIRGQSLINTFKSQSEAVENAQKRVEAVTAALDAYRAKAGANPTDNQTAQIEKRTISVEKAQGRLTRAQGALDQTVERMNRAGIATDNLETQFDQMAAAAVEAAQGMAAAKSAIDDYPASVKRAAAAMADLKDQQALAGRDTSFLKPDDFAFVQSLDTAKAKLEAISDAERRYNAETGQWLGQMSQRWGLQIRSLAEQERALKSTAAAQAKLDAQAQKRTDDAAAFRLIGQAAAEDAVKVERYAASVQLLGNDFQSFAATVRAAVGGTSSSLQDIGQAIQQVDASTELLASGSKRINELQASAGKLAIAIGTLDQTARRIDGFRVMQQSVQAAEATFAEAQAEVLRLARAVGEADEPSEALARELTEAQRALSRAGQEMQRTRNEAVKLADGLRRVGVDADNLDAEMARFAAAAQRAGTASDQLQSKLRGREGFLGLNPFELQNLGYQINDIFVSLASGQAPLTVLIQQGAQIGQLFSGFFTTLLKFGPLVIGITALLSPLIGALVQASRAASSLADANAILAASGNATAATTQQYAEAGVQLRNLGVSAEDAKTALKTFHDSGLDPAGLDRYTQVLGDASKAGLDLGDTSKLLTEALTGGQDAVRALNDEFGFLTPSEEAQIEKMIASGQESEARRILFEKFEDTAQRMADKANGPWGKAWDNLTSAFNNFTRAISNSAPFRTLGSWLDWIRDKITGAMDDIAYFLNYASKRGLWGTLQDAGFFGAVDTSRVTDAQREAAEFANRRGRSRTDSPFPAAAQDDTREGARAVRDLKEELREAREETKKLSREETIAAAQRKARLEATGSPAQVAEQARIAGEIAGIKYDEKAEKEAAKAAKKAKSAADKAKRAAETLARQRLSIEEQLQRDLASLEAKADRNSVQSLEDRLGAVDKAYTGLFQKIAELQRKGGTTIGGMPIAEYEAQARAQMQILKNQEQMKFYEDSINAAVKDRTDQLKAVEEAYDRGDRTPVQAAEQTEEIVSRFSPQIDKLASDALAFAQSLRTATPDPRLEAFVSRMERMAARNSGGQDRNTAKAAFEKIIAEEGQKLQAIIQQRDALVTAENTLVELGVKTRRDAQTAIEQAYSRTTPLIREQAEVMDTLLRQFVTRYPEMQTFYDTWQAKLQGIAATSEYVDARYTQLKSGVDGLITQNALNGIDQMAQALARLALGQRDVMGTLGQLGIAFGNFIAETLIGLGKLIMQMILLSAIERATGIPVGAILRTMSVAGLHTGGVVGQERTFSRRVPEAAFLNAPRYHGGGIAGFAPDEVGAVLKRNEEILTTSDPRHRFNLGSGAPPPAPEPTPFRQVLAIGEEEIANALAGPAGEKVVMTHIRRNKTTLKQFVGD